MKKIAGVLFGFVAPALLLLGFLFRQDIYDWNRLRNYTPPAEVAKLVAETTMRDNSRKLFYVHHPLIVDKASFNGYCRDSEHTIVLGCYIRSQGIYLLDVQDDRLNGIKQVTAAHELLHAVYDRMSVSERARIDKLTQKVYESVTNTRLRETVELYRKRDPSVVPNELHSILATEVRSLPKELEDHYAKYFSDRSKIVAFSEQYEQAFVERKNAIREYDLQLAGLKDEIDALQAQLQAMSAQLIRQRAEMNALRNSRQADEYNALVPDYNRKVNQYNHDIDALESLIVRYNDIVQKRNDIAAEEADLVKAIDSREVVPQAQ